MKQTTWATTRVPALVGSRVSNLSNLSLSILHLSRIVCMNSNHCIVGLKNGMIRVELLPPNCPKKRSCPYGSFSARECKTCHVQGLCGA